MCCVWWLGEANGRNPSASTREMLARKLGVPNTKTIGIWFQNR